MNDLFAPPAINRETFVSRGLSVVPVVGDEMLPTLRGDFDYVLAAPVPRFFYDSLYVVEIMGMPSVRRCQYHGNGEIGLIVDNERYGATPGERETLLTVDEFNACVLGIVVCDLKVRDHRMMSEFAADRRAAA
jgi:hypothetical protein